MSSMSETGSEPRRRISSQSDTLRSNRSEHQSPRVSRPSHHSISAPPETPPLVRATPQRHSVTTAPVTVISVTSPTVTSSHDSLDQDSGNPESELTTTSERGASRSPSDYRSLDCDSLSVDDTSDDNAGPGPGATVIHLTGDNIPNIDDDEDDLISNRRTLQTEVRYQ